MELGFGPGEGGDARLHLLLKRGLHRALMLHEPLGQREAAHARASEHQADEQQRARLLRRPEDGKARAATSFVNDALSCRNDVKTVAQAAMIAASTPSDIATSGRNASMVHGGFRPLEAGCLLVLGSASRAVVPVPGAFDRSRPTAQPICRFIATHVRLETVFDLPVARQLIERRPEAGAESREIGGAERSRLGDLRAYDRYAEQIGLELHQQIVRGRAAIDAQLDERARGVFLHRFEQLCALKRDGFEAARAMCARVVPRDKPTMVPRA